LPENKDVYTDQSQVERSLLEESIWLNLEITDPTKKVF